MTFGFEKEFFVDNASDGSPVWNPRPLPIDTCGYLVEVRTEPIIDPHDAVHSLMSKEYQTRQKAALYGWNLSNDNSRKVGDAEIMAAIKQAGGQKRVHVNIASFYGENLKVNRGHAGLHVNVGNARTFSQEVRYRTCKECSNDKVVEVKHDYINWFNWPLLITTLDNEFKQEIRDAKRQRGLYRPKPFGVEYRSLPQNINLLKLADILKSLDLGWRTE